MLAPTAVPRLGDTGLTGGWEGSRGEVEGGEKSARGR